MLTTLEPIVVPGEAPVAINTPVAPTTRATGTPPPPRAPQLAPSIVTDALLLAVLVGLAASGLAAALRKKFLLTATGHAFTLLACDLCVSFWSTAVFVAVWWYATALPITRTTTVYFATVFFAGVGVAYALVKLASALTLPVSADAFDATVVDTKPAD